MLWKDDIYVEETDLWPDRDAAGDPLCGDRGVGDLAEGSARGRAGPRTHDDHGYPDSEASQ